MDWKVAEFSFFMPLRYHLSAAKSGLVIVLHGYQDNVESMLRRLGWKDLDALPFRVLAMNAPFPVPVWDADGFKDAFAWYFRDASRGLTIVAPETTAEHLARLLRDLKLEDEPKVLFGFSQGGYLAPHLAKRTRNVRLIAGVGCGYPQAAYDGLAKLPVHAIHGEKDERISLTQARSEYEATGFPGEFHLIPGLEHRVNDQVEKLVRDLAVKVLR